jgi:hypothetical protein
VIFAFLHLLLRFPIGTVEVWSVAGWQVDGREGPGGGEGEWHGCIAKKQKKKLGVGAKLQRNTV